MCGNGNYKLKSYDFNLKFVLTLQRDSMSLGCFLANREAENIPIGSDPDNAGVENIY